MDTLHIIFPVNLYKKNKFIENKYVAVIEEKINFTYLNYHKAKLVLHRASMKSYFDKLSSKHKKYFEYNTKDEDILKFYKGKINTVEFIDPTDHLIVNKWKKLCQKFKLNLNIIPTLNFLITKDEIMDYYESTNKKKYYHDRSFYPYMRRKLNVLMTNDNKPEGNKWSFDKENRQTLPKNVIVPKIPKINTSQYVKNAIIYVEKNFKDNPGLTNYFIYPINHTGAKKWLKNFIEEKLKKFGNYQDFFKKDTPFVFHSVLSPLLNIGLLTDQEVLTEVLKNRKGISLNSLEGYLRQLIGWKQYIYFIYTIEGEKIRRMNFLKATRKIPKVFWTGNTKIPPIDDIIIQVQKYGYAHHIQRLMFLGNFMLLCGFHPLEVTNWFQEFVSIDAYDVFMIPNVMEMVCYAGGGIVMTRPYFSSSSYILRMSDYKKTDGKIVLKNKEYYWTEIFDALYYRFIYKYQNILKNNYSTANYVLNMKKKKNLKELINIANDYLMFL